MENGFSVLYLFSTVFLSFFIDDDAALRELAELERESCSQDIQHLRQKVEPPAARGNGPSTMSSEAVLICNVNVMLTVQVLELLIPEEEADMSDLVLEVTAGVGGQEAMLFTAEV